MTSARTEGPGTADHGVGIGMADSNGWLAAGFRSWGSWWLMVDDGG